MAPPRGLGALKGIHGTLAEHAPGIIAEAAKSTLGLFALMILAVSALAFVYFRRASERTRSAVFVMLFLGVAAFGASIVRSASSGPAQPFGPGPTTSVAASNAPAASLSAASEL